MCQNQQSNIFIQSVFRECRNGGVDVSIFVLQYISIIIWLIALLPQIRQQFLSKETDISIVFSIIWTVGDIISLTSMLLVKAMISQVVMQIYFVIVDIILFLQVLYYNIRTKIPKLSMKMRNEEIILYTSIVVVVIVGIIMYFIVDKEYIEFQYQQIGSTILSDQHCNSQSSQPNKKIELAGNIIGYISMPFFPLSRIVQIISNHRTQQVEGISYVMFILTILGNLTQVISLIIDIIANDRFLNQLPFLSNALLPLVLDFVILIQYKIISRRNMHKQQKDIELQPQEELEQVMERKRKGSIVGRQSYIQNLDLEEYEENLNKETQTTELIETEQLRRDIQTQQDVIMESATITTQPSNNSNLDNDNTL